MNTLYKPRQRGHKRRAIWLALSGLLCLSALGSPLQVLAQDKPVSESEATVNNSSLSAPLF